MGIHMDDMKVEGFELFVYGVGGADLVNRAVDLQPVIVHDDAQVIQFTESRQHGGLPYLAFLNLAVSQKGVDPEILTVHFRAQGHAHSGGDPLSQGTGGHIHPRDVDAGMPLQVRTKLTEGGQILRREKSPVRQCGIESRGIMSFGEHKPVPDLPVRVGRVNLHLLKIQIGEHIRRGKGASRMPCLCAVDCGDDPFPDVICMFL